MKNILFYILTAIIFLAPYKYLEQDNVNGMLLGIIAVFSIMVLKNIKSNKKYAIFLLVLTVVSILSLSITSLTVESLQGLSLYIGAFSLYFVFTEFKDKEEEILKVITYIMAVNCILYIVIQGAYYNGGILEGRIDGNIGYANTYALLMLIALYFNNIREEDRIKGIIDLLFIQGIFLTGSRNTLLYLGIFALLHVIYKKRETGNLSFIMIFNCILSGLFYIIISKLRLGGILIIPIILIIYFQYVDDQNRKAINVITLISIPIGIIGMFLSGSNLTSRITSASLSSNELQLRIGYLEDVISYVCKNPLGGGLNTYMYNQGSFQTGFYDIRYVHNSFGQALYDLGFVGLAAFTALFICGALVILKGNNKRRFYYMALYLTIYAHSLLDFDFAYMVIWTVVVMTIAFSGKCDIELKKNTKYLKVITALAGIYIFITTTTYYVADKELLYGRYEKAVEGGRFLSKITVGDSSSRIVISRSMRALGYDTGDIEYVKSALRYLEEVEDKNRKSYVYGEIASIYEDLGDIDKSCEYHEKNIKVQKHALYVYNSYCDMLTREEEYSGIDYEDKKAEIMNRYYTLEAERSEKSKKRFGEY